MRHAVSQKKRFVVTVESEVRCDTTHNNQTERNLSILMYD